MARGSAKGGQSWIVVGLRCLPALLLPFLVGVLHPQGISSGLSLVFLAAAIGTVIAAAVPYLYVSLVATALMAMLLLCTAFLQELGPEDATHAGGAGQGQGQEHLQGDHPNGPLTVLPHIDPMKLFGYKRGIDRTGQHEGAQPPQHDENAAAQDDGPTRAPKPMGIGNAADKISALRWRPQPTANEASTDLKTMSVVLPCAFEGEFAEKTVNAIWENSRHERIKEILVVDDGSSPPLKTFMSPRLLAGGPDVAPMRIIRHEKTKGLIGAKKSGGDAAVGDVIVFLDCHISPRVGWEEAFFKQMTRAGDHRTVVVPTITSLDPDTWTELKNGANGKVCYVLWNSDFTWLSRPGRDAPLMSGGLLGISRKWWQETEGYDEHMVAWGGENIDQSLRIWLCGGRIEVAEGAYIAHMWRDPNNPKTRLRYPIPTKDVMRNKARASKAWFGEFIDKVFSFPEYEAFARKGEPLGDMSNFDRLRNKLQCKPFSHYINRFSYVYLDSGLIPEKIFQIREKTTGLCLERTSEINGPHSVVLLPCGGGKGGGRVPEMQIWHRALRDPFKSGKPCCGGLMNWNFLQCMDATSVGSKLRTFDCEIQGGSQNQRFMLDPEGSGNLFWRQHSTMMGFGGVDGEGCVGFPKVPLGEATFIPTPGICNTEVDPVGTGTLESADGESVPEKFRLRSPQGDLCASSNVVIDTQDSSASILGFVRCAANDKSQILTAQRASTGFRIIVGEKGSLCLDAAAGSGILVYPCYDATMTNHNQMWQVKNGHLIWSPPPGRNGRGKDLCADSRTVASKSGHAPGEFGLGTCTPKKGQRIRKEGDEDGTFILRDIDQNLCVSAMAGGEKLGLLPCYEGHRWRDRGGQLEHVKTGKCLDAGPDESHPLLYACHLHPSRKQKFNLIFEPGWIQMEGMWGDNGRRRWFEKCLDSLPVDPINAVVQHCDQTAAQGVFWEAINEEIPLERTLWENAEKPPPGSPTLGGPAAPP
mmetsp:Transcript_73427/g.160825  ORF Transcript_73427/g.160825 Transcript_73427/m.160825 type:complete len:983 (+) Transcript_73427:116-3064(+)